MNNLKKINENLFVSAFKIMKNFKIWQNPKSIDLNEKNPGWHESEEDYLKRQKEWLDKVNKKKDDF
jgi:hypothetical protein